MSDTDTMGPADRGSLVAAEYVLGVLGAEERREVERRLAQEPALASEVAAWEERLGGLAEGVAPVAPPHDAWSRDFNAHESTDGSLPGYISPTRSASFPTEVKNVGSSSVLVIQGHDSIIATSE